MTFNEEINPATFTAAQVTLTGPGGVVPIDRGDRHRRRRLERSRVHRLVPRQTAAGTYTLTVGPGIQDWYGNDMNQNRNGVNGEAADAFTETGITVQAATLAKLVVTGFPASPTAGVPYDVTVTATDMYGNAISGYFGTVALSSAQTRPRSFNRQSMLSPPLTPASTRSPPRSRRPAPRRSPRPTRRTG